MKRGMQFTERTGEATGERRPAASEGSLNAFDDYFPFGSCEIEDDVTRRRRGRRIKP